MEAFPNFAMPVVRLVNPHLFGSHRNHGGGTRRHNKLSEKIAAIVQQEMHQAKRISGVESNPVVNGGTDAHSWIQRGEHNFMAKKHHHKKHHRNPHVRHRRHHRNPILAMSTSELLKSLAFAAGGNIVTDMVPAALGFGSGVAGYAAGAATAVLASWLAGKFAGSTAGTSALIGGGLAVLRKVMNDFFPNTFLSTGMSGDLAFYVNNGFPLPTTGSGPYLLNPGFTGSTPQMNGGMPVAVAPAVASNGQPIAAALPAPAGGGNGPWRGEQRWAA